jgi:hypothetical protein
VRLDEELRRLDVLDALAKRRIAPSSAIKRCLWRGCDSEKGKVTAWLAELQSGNTGYLGKVGRRWAWLEGSRDEMLAHVADDLFAEAAMAVASQ